MFDPKSELKIFSNIIFDIHHISPSGILVRKLYLVFVTKYSTTLMLIFQKSYKAPQNPEVLQWFLIKILQTVKCSLAQVKLFI